MTQKRNQTMTKRDKQLLYGLGLVVLLFLAYEVCFYLNRQNVQLEHQVQQLEMEYEAKEIAVMHLPALEAEREELQRELEENSQFLFPSMESYEVERYFTKTVQEYDLSVKQISVNRENSVTLLPYISVRTQEDEAVSGEAVCQWNIVLQLEGDEAALGGLLDTWSTRQNALHLVSYNLQEPYTVHLQLFSWEE